MNHINDKAIKRIYTYTLQLVFFKNVNNIISKYQKNI